MFMSPRASTAFAAWLTLASSGCNALLGIEEASLCDGAACQAVDATGSRTAASQGRVDTTLDTSGPARHGPDGGVPNETPTRAPGTSDAGAALEEPPTCVAPAPELSRDCEACGGVVACDGSCSVGVPPDLGAACGSCGGTIACNGSCSVMTPSDYGSMLPRDIEASFSCCFIDEVRSYGPDGPDSSGCYPGYEYDGCTVSKTSGRGLVSIVEEDAATCTCRVHVDNAGLDGASYTVTIRLKRGCQPE